MTQAITAINMPQVSLGSQGESVRFLQKLLIRYGYYTGAFDAKYGALTKKAVETFQNDYNQSLNPTTILNVDGVVGKFTWRAISEIL